MGSACSLSCLFFVLKKIASTTAEVAKVHAKAMIEPDGSMGNLIVAITGVILTMILAFAATMVLYREEETETLGLKAAGQGNGAGTGTAVQENGSGFGTNKQGTEAGKQTESLTNRITIASPIEGETLQLETIHDDAFASGVLGKGAAILPKKGEVYAPADGVVSTLFPTLHAIGLETDDGAELLIHIGLDTVQLEGKGFEAVVSQGQRVTRGQLLLKFDMEYIKGQGFCLETPVIVVNTDDYLEVAAAAKEHVLPGDTLITIVK